MASPRRHVAVVVPSLTRAGAERVAETLAREFARFAKVTIVTMEPRLGPRDLNGSAPLPWADRIPVGCAHTHLPSSGSGLSRLGPLVVRFAALARQQQFDAVYSFLTWTNVLVSVARLLGGRYVHVASEHALADSLRGEGGQLKTLAKTLPVIYRGPHWIVVVSDAVRDSLLGAGLLPRPERAVTIPNPVDGAEIRKLADAPCQISLPKTGQFVLMCVARLHPQKDHLTVLRAMTRLPKSYSLVLVGDGAYRSTLQEAVSRLGLGNRVVFAGVLENPYPLMRQAHAIVLASREEGFGLVAAEAAALGIPFVGSRVGGLEEVCALLGHQTFPVGDEKALASAVLKVSRQRGVSSASDTVGRLFDPIKISHDYLRLASHSLS